MDKNINLKSIAREMAQKASEYQLRRPYEELVLQQLSRKGKEELNEVLWHG
tara:strand:- start:896 stop:1048 length:153 start_codon:yes stop_codon:yes gene_type:complete